MYWGLIHRSIFLELVKVFLLAFVALTGLLLLAGLVAEATRNGLGPTQILAAIPLLLPSLMPYILPTTTLFATCVIYGRLANDNEILALRSAGVHIRHAMWPVVLLGALVSAATFALYIDVIPYTHYLLRTQLASDLHDVLYGMLRREQCIRHPRFNYEIHVTRVQGEKLLGAQFRRRDANNQFYDMIAFAREAELLIDMRRNCIHVRMKNCYVRDFKANIDSVDVGRVWDVELPDDMTGLSKLRPSDMTWRELFENREEMLLWTTSSYLQGRE